MALRALSGGPTTAINSGRSSISSSARTAKALHLARPITRPRFLRRPRIWFSRSRLILTSNARLASSAQTEWLSRSACDVSAASAVSDSVSSYMHRTIKPRPHHLRYAARIVAVRLVDLRLQHRLHVPRLNADHRQSCFGESAEQPLRQRSSFQPNSLEVVGEVLQHRQQRFRFARHLYFPNDLACVIHNADARLLDRNVQSSKMVHAALLLLMPQAVFTDLVSPSA